MTVKIKYPNNHIHSITVVLSYTLVTIHTEVESLVHCNIIQPIIIHQNLKLSCLNNLVFLSEELRGRAVLDWVAPVHLGALQHFDPTVALVAGEGHCYWEKVIWVSSNGELHGTTLVVLVNDGVLPQELLPPGVDGVLTLALRDVRSADTVWEGDGNSHVTQLQSEVLQLKLNVDVTPTLAIV